MKRFQTLITGMLLAAVAGTGRDARAQLVPEIGYAVPSGARAGTTVDVLLGGYDWTPDMQILVHDPRVKIELIGVPSKVLVPEPPFWFGMKARGPAWPLPRQFTAKMTIASEVPAGLIAWQVANANGISPIEFLHVSDTPEIVEEAQRQRPQVLPTLPVTVSGQIRRIEEIDEYEIRPAQTGPVTIELISRQLKSPLHAMLRLRDSNGKLLADTADSEGRDLALTFQAEAGKSYVLSLHDLDFAGDRSYVYRMTIREGARLLAAYPAAGKSGEVRKVEFLVATGSGTEAITADVAFGQTAAIPLPGGRSLPIRYQEWSSTSDSRLPIASRSDVLGLTDIPEHVVSQLAESRLPTPGAVTGSFETAFGSDRFKVSLKKGEKWSFAATARQIGSPLDLDLSVLSAEGKVLVTQDDVPGTTDASLEFAAPADGEYVLEVSDNSGKSGTRAAAYRLSCQSVREDFRMTLPVAQSIALGATAKLSLKVTRQGAFTGPIKLALEGLPVGVTTAGELVIPEKKNDLAIDLTCAADAGTQATLVDVRATATLNGAEVPRHLGKLAVATIMKPRLKITPEGLDDVRKVNRGSTYLAPLIIDRLEGYAGEVVLEMTSKQQRHRQGLASDEFVVAPEVSRVDYPIFVPEWMETTKTSRMILNGSVKVTDPKGQVRTLLQKQELRIGILPEGALLKLSHGVREPAVRPGDEVQIPVTISRAEGLKESVSVSLSAEANAGQLISSVPVTVPMNQREATIVLKVSPQIPEDLRELPVVLRATSQKNGLPVISETTVLLLVRR